MTETDQIVLAASEEVEKQQRKVDAALEDLAAAVEKLLEVLKFGNGAARQPPFAWGMITKWEVVTRGRFQIYTLDGRKLVLKRGRVAYTLQALLEAGGVLAGDGERYRTVSRISARVAELGGQPAQSEAAVHSTLTRVKTALKGVRPDWDELLVRNDEVRGYRLAKAWPSEPEPH